MSFLIYAFSFPLLYADAVSISTAPDITYTFNESSDGELLCAATGIPAATIYWEFEGENVTSNRFTNSFSVNQDLIFTTSSLTISPVHRSDAGMYTCVGINGVGSAASANSRVIVNCKFSLSLSLEWNVCVNETHVYVPLFRPTFYHKPTSWSPSSV